MNTYHYGSTATSNGLNLSRAFRSYLNHTAKRGPRPGIEVEVWNAGKVPIASNDGDSSIRKVGQS